MTAFDPSFTTQQSAHELLRTHRDVIERHHQTPCGLVADLLTEPVQDLHDLLISESKSGDTTAGLLIEEQARADELQATLNDLQQRRAQQKEGPSSP